MIHPSMDKIQQKFDSKYTIVILAAKRARQIRGGSPSLIETRARNDVTVALEEIISGKISFVRIKDGIK